MRIIFSVILLSLWGTQMTAQTRLSLQNMDDFRDQAGNWQIVGTVSMNPNVDIHSKPAPPPLIEEKKKKKKKKQNVQAPPTPPAPKAVRFQQGTGILLNMNTEEIKDHLITSWEHGDIELSLEVMIPRGSNSGIYLQGRYEVQLLDSWGVKNPKFSDIGGIYRNWEETPGNIFRGKAPASNPAKAPGLWQKIHLLFRAPTFDEAGNKITNAKFDFVDLNGVRIHNNVEVPLPTGGPIENNEVAMGPLMIQGDHGPVAFKNVEYTLLSNLDASVSDLTYKAYKGSFGSIEDFLSSEPTYQGSSDKINCLVTYEENNYGLTYKGKLHIKETNTYEFTFAYTGGGVFSLDGERLVDYQSGDAYRFDKATKTLEAGVYPFTIHNFKTAGWRPPRLGLYLKTKNTHASQFHAYESFPRNADMVSPIYVDAGASPKLLRAFLDFEGDRNRRITHNIGVASPSGINYAFDLGRGNLVCGWRGRFVDATPMWFERGDGSFRPRGAVQFTFLNQPLAHLSNENEPFPTRAIDYTPGGYQISETDGLPTFMYTYKGVAVSSAIQPDGDGKYLTHSLKIENPDSTLSLYYKLAEGEDIQQVEKGLYRIVGKEYFIELDKKYAAVIREQGEVQELMVPISSELTYKFMW
ncbi:MAG: family 16 glycoside hydrolase [Bacteroidota bacterium]